MTETRVFLFDETIAALRREIQRLQEMVDRLEAEVHVVHTVSNKRIDELAFEIERLTSRDDP